MDGTLFLVVGDRSDACMRAIETARRRFSSVPGIVVPRRAITRIRAGGEELHQAVTPAQFDRLRRDGHFALIWTEDGANYGIPAAIDCDLAEGRSVLFTAPKSMVEAVRARYPHVQIVEIGNGPDQAREQDVIFLDEDVASTEGRFEAAFGRRTRARPHPPVKLPF